MEAAMIGADDTVSFLLSQGAQPSQTDNSGNTAPIFAIQSKCVTTINLMVPFIEENLGAALQYLAQVRMESMTCEILELVKRAVKNKDAAFKGFEAAVKFGAVALMEVIYQHIQHQSVFGDGALHIWIEAIKSDSSPTVSALLQILADPPMEAITLAKERSAKGIEAAPA